MPTPGTWQVRFGSAELLPDDDRPAGWLLLVDGVAQSYVDLAAPAHLEFDYVRLIGDLVDLAAPEGAPLTALHLGGGGCTLARYVASTRPGSPQIVIEADDLLVAVIRRELGVTGFRLRVGDAREALGKVRAATSDLVISDVFAGSDLPRQCTTAEYLELVRRSLRPGGTYIANIGDGPPFGFARSQVATLRAAFAHVVLMAEPVVLRGRRFGNLVLAGSDAPLDVDGLSRRAARAIGRARVVSGDDARDFTGGAKPVTDATAADAPSPPPDVFSRR
ncbi:MAG: fused MFS/spermidine synthase [Mycobacteriales bacterium]